MGQLVAEHRREFERSGTEDVFLVPAGVGIEGLFLINVGEGIGERRHEGACGKFQMKHNRRAIRCLDPIHHVVITLANAQDPLGGVDDHLPAFRHIGRGQAEDDARIAAIREAIGPQTGFMVDLNCGYDLPTAMRALRRWEPHRLFWLEEPVPPHDLSGYTQLRSYGITPIAGGGLPSPLFGM